MVMHRTEPSRLQSLSLQLSDKLAQLVENNERLLELRPGGKYFLKNRENWGGIFPPKLFKQKKMSTLLETFVWIFLIDLNGHLSRNAFSRKTQCSLVCFCHKKFFRENVKQNSSLLFFQKSIQKQKMMKIFQFSMTTRIPELEIVEPTVDRVDLWFWIRFECLILCNFCLNILVLHIKKYFELTNFFFSKF